MLCQATVAVVCFLHKTDIRSSVSVMSGNHLLN